MSKCRSCGAEIIWIKTPGGKAMPCDAEPVVYWQQKNGSKTIVLNNGEVIKGELEGIPGTETGIGYISHFATCPDAERFRKRMMI